MAIINASGNPAMTSAEFSGGYLIACYDPSTPIYKVASNEDAPAPVLYDEYNYYFPSTDSATKGTGHIKWATRTWQLTDKGHSLVQTAIQNAKNNSEALITPFLDPRPLIRESYVEVAHKAVQRAIAKRVLQERRLVQIAAFDNAASDIDAGVNPQDIAAVSMPQLDESGLRSTWLPPSPALRAIDTPNGGNVSELAGLVANSGEVHGVFTGEDTQETEVSSDDSVSFY